MPRLQVSNEEKRTACQTNDVEAVEMMLNCCLAGQVTMADNLHRPY